MIGRTCVVPTLFLALSAALGCGDTRQTSGDAPSEEPSNAEASDASPPPLYVVQHNVNAPEGRLVYIQPLTALTAKAEGESRDRSLELSGYAAMQSFDGYLFVSNGETKRITKYEVSAAGEFTEVGELSLALEEIGTFWNENFLYLDSETALYANEAARELLVWNPKKMEIVRRVPIEGLDQVSELPVTFEGLVEVDGKIFMPVVFADWDSYQAHPAVTLVVLSAEDFSVEGIWDDDRCAIPMSALPHLGVTDDGTFYVLGDAGWSAWNHGAEPDVPEACVLRVLPGARGFDSEFQVGLDNVIEGYGDPTTLLVDDANERVYFDVLKRPTDPFEVVDDLWDYQLEEGNTRRVGCNFPAFEDCAFIDETLEGNLHWVQRQARRPGLDDHTRRGQQRHVGVRCVRGLRRFRRKPSPPVRDGWLHLEHSSGSLNDAPRGSHPIEERFAFSVLSMQPAAGRMSTLS